MPRHEHKEFPNHLIPHLVERLRDIHIPRSAEPYMEGLIQELADGHVLILRREVGGDHVAIATYDSHCKWAKVMKSLDQILKQKPIE